MSEIREIIEKYATDDNNDWCDLYQSIKDHDFDKLEKELQDYFLSKLLKKTKFQNKDDVIGL